MRKIRSLQASLVAAAAFAVLLLWPSTAQAATQVDQYRFKGTSATAAFYNYDGCVERDTYVAASQEQATLYVYIAYFNYCSAEYHFYSVADALPQGALTVDGKLTTASLVTTIAAYDGNTGTTVPVKIDVRWAGTGPLYSSVVHQQIKSPPNYVLTISESGTFRTADASGSVSDGTRDYAVGAASYAQLSSVKYGAVSVTRS